MYLLIKARIASKSELESDYTMDEALKLYALWQMDKDIEQGELEEIKAKTSRQ